MGSLIVFVFPGAYYLKATDKKASRRRLAMVRLVASTFRGNGDGGCRELWSSVCVVYGVLVQCICFSKAERGRMPVVCLFIYYLLKYQQNHT